MDTTTTTTTTSTPGLGSAMGGAGAGRLAWLTPRRGRLLLVLFLLWGFLGHLWYLHHNCPLDLAPDEAQYWDWSRQLGLSYYSKGPLVAYVIRASCAIFGDTMPAVRLPALLLAAGTSLCTWWLTRKLFGSERLALGAVLLNALVPMFVAGSVLMTIDPPFFFCWALATCLAAAALWDQKRWAWIAVGLVVGVGFLAKYTMFLWLLGLALFMLVDAPSRRWWRTRWPWIALAVALLFTIPVIVWNAQHGWVSALHVATQTVAAGESAKSTWYQRLPEMVGGQIGAVGPFVFAMMAGAVVWTLRRRAAAPDPRRREAMLLLWIGLPFWSIVLCTAFFSKVQVNWPAPAYFSLVILAAHFVSGVWQVKAWRACVYGAIVLGVLAIPLSHNSQLLYRPVAAMNAALGTDLKPRRFDPSARLRGWRELGQFVGEQLARLGPSTMVIGEDYSHTAEMAFYVTGQPKTYYAGSYFTKPKRLTHYDMWPDRALDQPALRGRDAVYVGNPREEIVAAFERIERLPDLEVKVEGLSVRTFGVWRCYGFKGMRRPEARQSY